MLESLEIPKRVSKTMAHEQNEHQEYAHLLSVIDVQQYTGDE